MAAPDIVLQLVSYATIEPLRQFANGTDVEWLQALCPALGRILQMHRNAAMPIPLEIRNIARWLADRADTV